MKFLRALRYPGRFLILGQDGDSFAAIYGATGRNPTSLQRTYIAKENDIVAIQLSSGGNPDLLEYPALRLFDNGFVIANGRQSERIPYLTPSSTQEQLTQYLSLETVEPDKYSTPRITGAYNGTDASIHCIRASGHDCYAVPLISNQGSYIATYNGEDIRPTPSFMGPPTPVTLNFGSAYQATQTIFDYLAPPKDQADYRVAVLACYTKHGESPIISVINKLDYETKIL